MLLKELSKSKRIKQKSKYTFAFTAASLRLSEMVKVARALRESGNQNLNVVKESGVVFGSVKNRTTDRQFREIRKRLEGLTPAQIELLATGDLIAQKQIAFLAVCKRYAFISDFMVEVVRDKTLVFDYQLRESDFNSFINNKHQLHPELEEFEESTFAKAKQVMFHILEQAGIIDNPESKRIQPQLLSHAALKAIAMDDRAQLRYFLMPDRDIKDFNY